MKKKFLILGLLMLVTHGFQAFAHPPIQSKKCKASAKNPSGKKPCGIDHSETVDGRPNTSAQEIAKCANDHITDVECIADDVSTGTYPNSSTSQNSTSSMGIDSNVEVDGRVDTLISSHLPPLGDIAVPSIVAGGDPEASVNFNVLYDFPTQQYAAFRQPFSPTEDFYTLGDKTYIVWTKGLKKGKIYDIIQKPSDEILASAPKGREVLAQIDLFIFEFLQSKEKDRGINLDYKIYNLYFNSRLSEFRFYDNELNDLIFSINSAGLLKWICNRIQTQFEVDPEAHEGTIYFGLFDAPDLVYKDFLHSNKGEVQFLDPQDPDPVYLTHGTFSMSLSSIINEGALKSDSKRNADLPKFNGEHGRGYAYTSDQVSFYRHDFQLKDVQGGYSWPVALEYPIAFGVSKSKSETLQLRNGTLGPLELVVDYELGLDKVTHMFVPKVMIPEVERILKINNLSHIKVYPTLNK